MRAPVFATRLLFAAVAPLGALHAAPSDDAPVQVELISEGTALVPGQSAWLGLRLRHAPQWHTYWANPGDSGLPTRLTWTLPAGFAAAEIAWPVPQRFRVGDLYNFGYEGDRVLPVAIQVPAAAVVGSTVRLGVEAKWLVCHEECIPGKASLHIDLPVAAASSPNRSAAPLFSAARASQPSRSAAPAAATVAGDRVEVAIDAARLTRAPKDAFAVQTKIVANAPPTIGRRDGKLVLSFAKSDYFSSVPDHVDFLLVDDAASATLVSATFTPVSPPAR